MLSLVTQKPLIPKVNPQNVLRGFGYNFPLTGMTMPNMKSSRIVQGTLGIMRKKYLGYF